MIFKSKGVILFIKCVILNTLWNEKKEEKETKWTKIANPLYHFHVSDNRRVCWKRIALLECLGARCCFRWKRDNRSSLLKNEKKNGDGERERGRGWRILCRPGRILSHRKLAGKLLILAFMQRQERGFNVALTFPWRLVPRVFCEARAPPPTTISFAFFPTEYNFLLMWHEFPYPKLYLRTLRADTCHYTASRTWQK